MLVERIAKRYAGALTLLLTQREDQIKLEDELAVWVAWMQNDADLLSTLINNPTFSKAERQNVVNSMFKQAASSDVLIRFLHVLIDRDRLDLLPAIYNAYREALDERFGRVRATLTSASPLDNQTLASVSKALEKRLNKQIMPKTEIDKQVLGGVRVNIGGLVFDGTLSGKLSQLKRTLLEHV